MIEEAIYARLAGDSAITTQVGTRIEPLVSEQTGAMPRIVYERVGSDHNRSLTGNTGGLCRATYDIDCIAATYATAKTLAELVRQRLDNFVGQIALPDATLEHVNSVTLLDDDDDYSQPADGGGKGEYTVRLTFEVWYGETVPTGV